jgi:hypothetical protein
MAFGGGLCVFTFHARTDYQPKPNEVKSAKFARNISLLIRRFQKEGIFGAF